MIRETPTADWTLRTLQGSGTRTCVSGKWSKKGHPGGVQPFIPMMLRPLLASAGYRAVYGRLRRDWSVYLSAEAATVRFSLMDESAKASVGSPARLLEACVKAYSMLKSRNRMSTPASYDQCLAEALAAG